jgi:beta-glucosidase
MSETFRFPKDFLWGAATSSYQIEGSPLADGAGPSIWHRFSHTAGAILNGDTGDVACDHYRRWERDVLLMKQLGIGAYRFSLAWSRILPSGRGAVNPPGLAFYDRLVDRLLEQGISPAVTLYHWDLPAPLDDLGGWLNRDISGWFADYADIAVRALGDRVALWTTLNEPWVSMDAGYMHGTHAPGHRSVTEAGVAAHNLLRAHGAGMQAIRASGGRQAGLVVNLEPKYAATGSAADLAATRLAGAYMNRHFLDPVFLGRYPEELAEIYGAGYPGCPAEDYALIAQPLDYLGINYYTRNVTESVPGAYPFGTGRVRQDQHAHTTLDWEVYPPALTDVLLWVKERYGAIPLYITENGAAFPDPDGVTEAVHPDPLRVSYLADHLRAARDAMARGVDLRGYFVWSLMDNFEWSAGFSHRFGLYHVNFVTQTRTPKASARFYAEVIRTHGEILNH